MPRRMINSQALKDGYPDMVGIDRQGEIRVRFQGCIQQATFNSEGAAAAHLDLLRKGYVQPCPVTIVDGQPVL